MTNQISIRGAREHNLKNLDIDIPRDKLVVITGLSGSGKSSLAFDTIYAEGQRRYVESLSAYARQFLAQNQKPDVESVEGLSPAIAIEQKTTGQNPRSTVATLTEIYDYLRLLYARAGRAYCYQCGQEIEAQSATRIVDQILDLPLRTKILVMAPIVRGRKGAFIRDLTQLRKEGFGRVRVDGELRELNEEITLDKKKAHSIEVVIDRLIIKEGIKTRLSDSVELALKMAEGLVLIGIPEGEEFLFSEHFACTQCDISYPEAEPRLFSFNSPFGACRRCDGLGYAMDFDPAAVVPDTLKSIKDGALEAWTSTTEGWTWTQLEGVADHFGGSLETPWEDLSSEFKDALLYGTGETSVKMIYKKGKERFEMDRPYEGIIPTLKRRMKETSSEGARERMQQYLKRSHCEECEGSRLRPEARSIRVGDKSISELTALCVSGAEEFFQKLTVPEHQEAILQPIRREILERLRFLKEVGLDYITLNRVSGTLSGGEAQRIRLATQIGSALRGVIYVLDEPSIGLHQRDNERLLKTLESLRDLGNTVLVVEHDEETIRRADWVVDLGPGAGRLGGEVVAEGPPAKIEKAKKSITGAYLRGEKSVSSPRERRKGNGKRLILSGAKGNNLQNIDLNIPLGTFVAVTGVSGSGKSTLVNQTLHKALATKLNRARSEAMPFQKLTGVEFLDKVIDIDQSAIGRTPRSNPATYAGLFTLIRDLFASLPESRARGYKAGRYSFNVKGGRCEACKGDGLVKIEMHFLPDVYVKCDECKGRRYNRETLEVLYKGKSIADVLEMTVNEAHEFFSAVPKLEIILETLRAVGLGYVHLGQSATTLSGGEAQRVKLAKELSKRATGKTLYILDEPTTGLHFYDVERLLGVLQRLVDGGNTVLVIEHNLDVIKSADHVIDLGPEGGVGGGLIVAEGTPEQVAKTKKSYTGQYLKRVMS